MYDGKFNTERVRCYIENQYNALLNRLFIFKSVINQIVSKMLGIRILSVS